MSSLIADHAFLRLVWGNTAEVIPGRLYRSNHPTPRRLARLVRRFGIRTVVNLRGSERYTGSNVLSEAAAVRLGVAHAYIPFESRGAPQRDRILRFYDNYRGWAEPALVHCKSGADRAGLAAGLVILFEGGTAAQALAQLSLRYLHFRRSSTGILDAFFLRFQAEAEGNKPFLDWVREDYDEAALRQSFRAAGLSSFINDRVLARE
ncbi:MAG TPA: tyrosine-protein phosphatase [Acetobacteraceae bacterium]